MSAQFQCNDYSLPPNKSSLPWRPPPRQTREKLDTSQKCHKYNSSDHLHCDTGQCYSLLPLCLIGLHRHPKEQGEGGIHDAICATASLNSMDALLCHGPATLLFHLHHHMLSASGGSNSKAVLLMRCSNWGSSACVS